jgi:hypothetical protein
MSMSISSSNSSSSSNGNNNDDLSPPFARNVHIMSATIDEDVRKQVDELRAILASSASPSSPSEEAIYRQYEDWCTDEQLHRFLIARQYHVRNAFEMIIAALKWRLKRIPADGVESLDGWEARMSKEGETGKMYIPGLDKYRRPIIVADDSAQNTVDEDGRLSFVAWYMEYACRLMDSDVDKFVTFIHFENFSIFGGPSMRALQESIFMATTAFPERLGHCIIYRPPTTFKFLWNALTPFIDSKTMNKIKFVTGNMDDGSANDVLLKEIIGDNWKVLCGAEQPVVKKGNSPGYDHSVHWPMSMSRYQDMICREQAARAAKLLEHSCYLDPATGSVTRASAWDFCAAANDFTNSLEFARILEQLAVAWGSMEDAIDEEELQSATSDQVAVDCT